MLTTDNLSFAYKDQPVLDRLNLCFSPGINAVIGPNGAGKSTLIKCLAGVLKATGSIFYKGVKVEESHRQFYEQYAAYLPQTPANSTSIRVFEAVLIGLLHSLPLRVGDPTIEKVLDVLEGLGIGDLAFSYLSELSGGQQQLVSIAQTIIKEPEVILLDEPISNLDIQHQFEILNKIAALTRQKGIITLIALHDLNMTFQYADHVTVLEKGTVHSQGDAPSVITAEMIRQIYKVDARIDRDSTGQSFVHLKGLAVLPSPIL